MLPEAQDLHGWPEVGLVVIGRNEGERLAGCLQSVRAASKKVYVDSGSTDGSVALARKEGLLVVELTTPPKFSAARARNAGLACLLSEYPDLEFVQMIDGDCEMVPRWFSVAKEALLAESDLALVFGRRRERFPERSIYNALCDDEWNVPVGISAGCGGDAVFRVQALRQVGFYNAEMIAGEDTELSMRLRKSGWRLRRIDADMTVHDANLTRFGQWWNRTRRSGHAYGEMAYLHPDARDPHWPRQVRSILFWGGGSTSAFIVAFVLALTVNWLCMVVGLLVLAAWVIRTTQLAARQRNRGLPAKIARASGIALMVGKIPQFLGVMSFYRNRILGRTSRIIEYKLPTAS